MIKYTKVSQIISGLSLIVGLLCAQEPSGDLGIIMKNVDDSIAAQQDLRITAGVLVVDIVKESPAEKGGLMKNDVILKIDGRVISDTENLSKMVMLNANKTVKVDGIRASLPFSLPVFFGAEHEKGTNFAGTTLNEEAAGDLAEKNGHSRQAIDHYLNALKDQHYTVEGDADFRLRQKIISIVHRLNVPPATPEQAERAMSVARAVQAEAKDGSGYNKAIRKYEEALQIAPWLADLYFNLGALCERNGNFNGAIRNFKLYLLAAPDAEDSQKVKDKIYLLEDKQKEKVVADAAATEAQKATDTATARAQQAAIEAKLMTRVIFSLGIGINSLKSNTVHWTEEDSFDLVYKGIRWDPGLHLGIEYTVNEYSHGTGNSFVFSPGTIGVYYESNTSSASEAELTSTDLVTHIPTTIFGDLPEEFITLRKINVSDKISFGYRVMLMPAFAFEPYGGIGLRGEISWVDGPKIKDDWTNLGLCIGIPLGARIYIGNFYTGFEYNPNVVMWWGREFGHTIYEGEKISLSREGASYWTINIGVFW